VHQHQLNERIKHIPLPDRMRHLPVSSDGYPCPRFISWINGKPDFRSIEPDKLGKAVRLNLCWLCGQALGSRLAMVVGPMCIINRVSSEPPCHRECAEYAVVACPFLSDAIRRRNTRPFVPGGDRLDIEHSETSLAKPSAAIPALPPFGLRSLQSVPPGPPQGRLSVSAQPA
jgi:hypothetical protein